MSRVPRSYKINNRRLIPDTIRNPRVRYSRYALPRTAETKRTAPRVEVNNSQRLNIAFPRRGG